MPWLKVPERGVSFIYSNAIKGIFLSLIQHHFHVARGELDNWFYITDRDLASRNRCSLRTIWQAKKFLRDNKFLDFNVGHKNRTYYKILNGDLSTPKK